MLRHLTTLHAAPDLSRIIIGSVNLRLYNFVILLWLLPFKPCAYVHCELLRLIPSIRSGNMAGHLSVRPYGRQNKRRFQGNARFTQQEQDLQFPTALHGNPIYKAFVSVGTGIADTLTWCYGSCLRLNTICETRKPSPHIATQPKIGRIESLHCKLCTRTASTADYSKTTNRVLLSMLLKKNWSRHNSRLD